MGEMRTDEQDILAHPARGGQIRTPEQDILDDVEAIRRNLRYSPATKLTLIKLQEIALWGYSPTWEQHLRDTQGNPVAYPDARTVVDADPDR